MSDSSYFRQKAKDLSDRLNRETLNVKSKDLWSTQNIAMIATPIAAFLLLWLLKPGVVTVTDKDGEKARSGKKLILWTAVLSMLIYAGV